MLKGSPHARGVPRIDSARRWHRQGTGGSEIQTSGAGIIAASKLIMVNITAIAVNAIIMEPDVGSIGDPSTGG